MAIHYSGGRSMAEREPRTLGERLRAAIEQKEISVREFHRQMDGRGVPGSSYPNIHRYLADKAEPTLDFLRHAAELLVVRYEWLSVDAGPMLEDEKQAETELDAISLAAAMTMKRSPTEELGREYWEDALRDRDSVLQGWARRGAVFMTQSYMPYWVAPFASLRQRLGVDREQLGEVLAAPLRALGLNPAQLNRSRGEPLATYIIAMVPVLMALAPEVEAQRSEEE
jgi:transcriptional regulator with XRE-family HTH domain